jgi:Tol biopolymer transport system component
MPEGPTPSIALRRNPSQEVEMLQSVSEPTPPTVDEQTRAKSGAMRKLIIFGLLAGLATMAALIAMPAAADPPGQNGRIVFGRFDPTVDNLVPFVMNPDGSHVQQLVAGAPQHIGDAWQWSPDGSRIATLGTDVDAGATAIIDPDTGSVVRLPMPNPDIFTACDVWSPDAARLACESFGQTDASLNGIYTIRSSDGGGLTRMTSNPGGDDSPGAYSPDGRRLAFIRVDSDGNAMHFVVNVNGTGLRQITPIGMILNFEGGDWSTQGNEILFSAHASDSVRGSLWTVHSDGTGLRQIPIAGCGGAFSDPGSRGCFGPSWSPDGNKIVFAIFTAASGERNIYTVNANGSGLTQVTHGGFDETPDWGTHP